MRCVFFYRDSLLTVLDASRRPAVLSLHSYRFASFFEKAGLIDDHYSLGIGKYFPDIGAQLISHFVAIPSGSI
jgi:hypothetical protein